MKQVIFRTSPPNNSKNKYKYSPLTKLEFNLSSFQSNHQSDRIQSYHHHKAQNKTQQTMTRDKNQRIERLMTENCNPLVRHSRNFIKKIRCLNQTKTKENQQHRITQFFKQLQLSESVNKKSKTKDAYSCRNKTSQKYRKQRPQQLKYFINQILINQPTLLKPRVAQKKYEKISICCIKEKTQNNQHLQVPSYHSGLQSLSVNTFENICTDKIVEQQSNSFEQIEQPVEDNVGRLKIIEKLKSGYNSQIYRATLKTFDKVIKHQEVIIKKVKIDKEHISREKTLAQKLKSPYIVEFKGTYTTQHFFQEQKISQTACLNIIMEKYDMDLNQLIQNSKLSPQLIKIYFYQMLRGLVYLHSLNICHRDLKPHNFFIKKWKIVLGDFGMSKTIKRGYDKIRKQYIFRDQKKKFDNQEKHVPYVFSRPYRAPELILGHQNYTLAVDIWALACIVIQMHIHQPLFNGSDNLDQLIKIMKVLGSPKWELLSFYHKSPKLPKVKGIGLQQALRHFDNKDLIELLEKMLEFDPKNRVTAIEALCSPYFQSLRQESTYRKIFSEYNCPNFFDFTKREIYGNQQIMGKIIPFWIKEHCKKYRLQISEIKKL